MTPFVTAGAGFLLAVLWFDLMHDVQVRGHPSSELELPEAVLASIAGYYRRVTTDARPMNQLIAAVMLVTLASLVAQIVGVGGDIPVWVPWTSFALALSAIGLAALRIVPRAVRLGGRSDTPVEQSRLARLIFREHVYCLAAMSLVLVIELAGGR